MTPTFTTDRIRQLRQSELDEQEKRTLDHIENFGCSVFHIGSSEEGRDRPLFSYSVGIFDTCGKPEIITVGLKEGLSQSVINAAAKLLRDDVDLAHGRHRDLVGEVECEFRPVDPKWTKHLMGWAKWYNGGSQFPVLQCVYPDLQNRFPEDDGFNDYFDQPLLQPDAPMRTIEEDFWAANDPESSLFDWKFPDPPHTGVYLSKAVHSGIEAINYVSHDLDDGAWQFLGDTMAESGEVLSCFHHPIDSDPSLKDLADLPLGWCAERAKPGEPWIRREIPAEEASESE
jgi:hypothetical protein